MRLFTPSKREPSRNQQGMIVNIVFVVSVNDSDAVLEFPAPGREAYGKMFVNIMSHDDLIS